MNNFFTNKYIIILIVISIVLLLVMAFFTADRTRASYGENILGVITMPVQKLMTNTGKSVGSFFDQFKNAKALQQQVTELEDKNAELENKIRELESYQEENDQLRELLDLKNTMRDYSVTAAQVVAKDSGNWYYSFTIDKGTSSGLEVKQAVITSRGLIGYISDIGTNWAKVETIISNNNSVAANVVRTSDAAIVEGDLVLGNDGLCKMTYVSKGADLTTGDLIETSGLGGIYPKGILIGRVREVKADVHGVSQYAVVEPAADLSRVDQVFVVKLSD